MISHTVLRLQCDDIAGVILLKLNEEDGFVRIEGPCFEVLYLSRSQLATNHITASNIYGIPQFHLVYHHHNDESVRVKCVDNQNYTVKFSDAVPLTALCISDSKHLPALKFSIMEGLQLSTWEKQMVAAAIAWCAMHPGKMRKYEGSGFPSPHFAEPEKSTMLA
jgi:hypothetical protein